MIDTKEGEVEAKKTKLLKLIDGKAYKLADKYAEREHKSISYFGKENGEFLVNGAKIVLLDKIIAFLNNV